MANVIEIKTGDHRRITYKTQDYADQAPLTAGEWTARASIAEEAGKTSIAVWTVRSITTETTTVTSDTLVVELTLTPDVTRSLIALVAPPTKPTASRSLTMDIEITGPGVTGTEIHTHGPIDVLAVQDVTL